MDRRWVSLQSALEHNLVQGLLACALLVPVVATVGQYSSSGFWTQSIRVELLFWPGQEWKWAVRAPVWASMGAMLVSYLAGIGWLLRKRTLSVVVLAGVGALVIANLAGGVLNGVTGWKELQTVSLMDLAGKANRAIFSLWHNPAWEELVFRGVPLALLLFVRRSVPRAARGALWCFYLLPSLVFAAYHVPGHGPSRLVDTFILSLAFAWMTLRFTLWAPLVMHYIFDALITLSLGKMPNIPRAEVAWLADHRTALNSAWSITLLMWFVTAAVIAILRWSRWPRRAVAPGTAPADTSRAAPE